MVSQEVTKRLDERGEWRGWRRPIRPSGLVIAEIDGRLKQCFLLDSQQPMPWLGCSNGERWRAVQIPVQIRRQYRRNQYIAAADSCLLIGSSPSTRCSSTDVLPRIGWRLFDAHSPACILFCALPYRSPKQYRSPLSPGIARLEGSGPFPLPCSRSMVPLKILHCKQTFLQSRRTSSQAGCWQLVNCAT